MNPCNTLIIQSTLKIQIFSDMQKTNILILSAAATMLLASCSKLGELGSENFKAVPNPLESHAGNVAVVVNGMIPEKYMKKKAVITITPELRYADKTVRGSSTTLQGEKVAGNDQVISYLLGGTFPLKSTFNYENGMEKSELYLVFDAMLGKKQVDLPAVKVADGVVATSEFYRSTVKSAAPCIAPDSFKRVSEEHLEANIRFLIQQATLRKSELENNSVTEFVKLIQKIGQDPEGLNVSGIEVSAYASPDGGLKLNEKLADARQKATEKYLSGQMKQSNVDSPIDAKYTAQDWEGFQQLVGASDIQDKDVILRVLSMYKDPEEREQQIKNISAGFRELADGILPQLRRARLTINYEIIGRDDEQIEAQLASDATQLSVDEMLYAATLTEDLDRQEQIYKQTTTIYPNDCRAYNNIAAIEYAKGNYSEAKKYIQKAQAIDPKNAEATANLALMSLTNGKVDEAEQYLAQSAEANGVKEALGNLALAKGNYPLAEQYFKGISSNSAALAQILNRNYAQAATTLNGIAKPDGNTHYLQAILAARQGNKSAAAAALESAFAKDPSLKDKAAQDLEFLNIR